MPHASPFVGPPIAFDHTLGFDPTIPQPAVLQTPNGFLLPYPSYDPMEFYAHPLMEYDEYAENLSRPRLTKEQVDTLEAQFRAHPKPNSNVKRQLAVQTSLSLPRVAVCLPPSILRYIVRCD